MAASLACTRRSPAPPEPAPRSSQSSPGPSASLPVEAPIEAVETQDGCWNDAGSGSAEQRLARLGQACVAGQIQLRELPLQPDRTVEVPLPAGVHCLRALAAATEPSADPSLWLHSQDGRQITDAIASNVAVVPPHGPLCVQGPTRVTLRLQGKSGVLLRLYESTQPPRPAPSAASQ